MTPLSDQGDGGMFEFELEGKKYQALPSRSIGDDFLEMVALAKAKGYAIDMSIYGGEHLDVYAGGLRITGLEDPTNAIKAGVSEMRLREANHARAEQLARQAQMGST